ncbi:tetratricopeptide repeat protein [Allostella humosa]|nr:acetate--CoA ligase family protein [Stella humosa]
MQAALERRPDDDALRLKVARGLIGAGDAAAALPHLRRLMQVQPPHLAYWLPMAEALLVTGDLEAARELIERMQRSGVTGDGLDALLRQLAQAEWARYGIRILERPVAMAGLAGDCVQPALRIHILVDSPPGLDTAELASAMARALDLDLGAPPPAQPAEGTAMLLRSLVVALQQAAGLPAFDTGAALPGPGGRGILLLVPYGDEAAARRAAVWAAWAISSLLAVGSGPARWARRLASLARSLPELVEQLRPAASPTGNAIHFLRAAHRMGVPWRRFGAHAYQIGNGARSRWLDSTLTDRTPGISVRLAQDKMVTCAILRRAGLPVPAHELATTVEHAVAVAARLGYPVVVKPLALDGGAGVAAGLEDEAALRRAFADAGAISDTMLVEKHVEGDDYRLVVVDGRVTWAIERVAGGVRGDGERTLAALLEELNADPRRGNGKEASLRRVDWDEEAAHLARRQGLGPDSVPAAGRFVRLRRITNVARGGMPVPLPLERIHPDNIRMAERAAAALRLDLAGIDFIVPDIARPWHAVGGAINEVNARPSLGLITAGHLFPDIIAWMLGGDGRIPIVGIVAGEDAPATDLARRIHRLLCDRGLRAGLAIAAGAWIGDEQVSWADQRGEAGGALLLTDVAVEAAVLHLPREGLAIMGIPFDRCDVLVRLDADGPPDFFEKGLLRRATSALVGLPDALADLADAPAPAVAVQPGPDLAGRLAAAAMGALAGLPAGPAS